MRIFHLIAWAWLGLFMLQLPAHAAGDVAPPEAEIRAAIQSILEGPDKLPLPLERIRPALKAHYIDNNGDIYWVGTDRMTPFIQRLVDADEDGLNPDDYPVDALITLRDGVTETDAFAAAGAELYFSTFLVSYATDLKIGRVIPQKVDPKLFRNRKTVDVLRILTDLNKQLTANGFLSNFESQNPQYQQLKKMLVLYRAMADSTDWPVIPPGPNINPGGSDERIPLIRKLLSMTGDYQGEATDTTVYDGDLMEGVIAFQYRNGLEAKGLIGKQTLLAMNITPEDRVRQITLNMERWRWLPENLGNHYFMVNLAAYQLHEVQDEQVTDSMDVVVGAVATQTPEFSDELEYVELNPTWTVPYSIATREMLPKLRRNAYAYADDFDVFMNGRIVSWGSVNWSSYGPGSFPFTFRQRPGSKNALGKVKFMLPNPYNIYLHDTPAKDKFLATTRAFSHGCIRLSQPVDLTYRIVGGIVGWPKEKIDATWAGGKTTRVPLPEHIPVHLVYATAFYGANGVEFRPDVYGRDRKLYAALFGKPTSS